MQITLYTNPVSYTHLDVYKRQDPESGQQSRDGKPNGFYYSEHRTVDSKRNVIVNVHVEAANINDVTPMPEILDEIEARLGKMCIRDRPTSSK